MRTQTLFKTFIAGIDAGFVDEGTVVYIERDGILKPVQGAIHTEYQGKGIVILHTDEQHPGLTTGQLVAPPAGEESGRG